MDAAFTLGFGQFDDPTELPGLAHLTEHLLLSGPGPEDEQQLETWLEPRGGESNGYTGFESALFTLSSATDFEETLRRFGHCFRAVNEEDSRFVAPAVRRETQRIDSEFQETRCRA